MKFSSLAEKAEFYARNCHRATNHMYGDKPYEYHLEMVIAVAREFQHVLPEDDVDVALAGCWVHDAIEDARQTYNDVREATHERVADVAYALTNEKGRTRKERANEKYYAGIRGNLVFTFCKLCDRIANARHSRDTGSGMYQAYQKELAEFVAALLDARTTDRLRPVYAALGDALGAEVNLLRPYMMFLDDERDPTSEYCAKQGVPQTRLGHGAIEWTVTTDYDSFVSLVSDNLAAGSFPSTVWFDHDLGEGKSGLEAARWLSELCLSEGIPLPRFASHSSNPDGKKAILLVERDHRRQLETK